MTGQRSPVCHPVSGGCVLPSRWAFPLSASDRGLPGDGSQSPRQDLSVCGAGGSAPLRGWHDLGRAPQADVGWPFVGRDGRPHRQAPHSNAWRVPVRLSAAKTIGLQSAYIQCHGWGGGRGRSSCRHPLADLKAVPAGRRWEGRAGVSSFIPAPFVAQRPLRLGERR